MNPVTRREVLIKLSGAIAAAALAPGGPGRLLPAEAAASGLKMPAPRLQASGTGKSRFFSAEEKEAIATVADLIIPDDEFSPGARAAGVHDWIDFLVANSAPEIQARWREGLAALDRASEEACGRKFLDLGREQQRNLLGQFAAREADPGTLTERFFVLAKEATVNGYYTSEIGLMKDLQFQGGTYASEPETSCPARVEHGLKRETP